jgi:hypothetical protein
MEKKKLKQLVSFLRVLGVNKVKLSENSAESYCGIIELELEPIAPKPTRNRKTSPAETPLKKDPPIKTDEAIDFLNWSTFQIEENN